MADPIMAAAEGMFQFLEEKGLAKHELREDKTLIWEISKDRHAVHAAVCEYYKQTYGEDSDVYRVFSQLHVDDDAA